jgi:hypothetical protein
MRTIEKVALGAVDRTLASARNRGQVFSTPDALATCVAMASIRPGERQS